MKKGILLNNALVKSLALFVMMLISYNGMAQDYTFNVGGKGKVYYNGSSGSSYYYVANIISSKEHSFTKELLADKIMEIGHNSDCLGIVSSSHGYFIEFIYKGQPVMTNSLFGASGERYMLVLDGSNLYLVERDNNNYYFDSNGNVVLGIKTVGTITNDLNNRGDDFQIFYDDGYFFILNNGTIKAYSKNKLKNTSSVRSPEVDKSDSKTYSLDGKQVESPHNGIFIRGGKKVVIK